MKKLVLVLFFAVLFLAACGEEKDSAKLKADYKLASAVLWNEYEENEVNADTKYKGKILEVTGMIDNIGTDITNTLYITLEGDDFVGSIQCFFNDKYKSDVAKLTKGQKVTIRGRCEGKFLNVLVKDSYLAEYWQ